MVSQQGGNRICKIGRFCSGRRFLPGQQSAYEIFCDGWRLTDGGESVSFIRMRRERLVAAREKLLERLPVTGEILRGSLLDRTIATTPADAPNAQAAKDTGCRC